MRIDRVPRVELYGAKGAAKSAS
eukprot:COSAG01_NODE_72324_length_253_cov_0.675325_1_plen_22_part_10